MNLAPYPLHAVPSPLCDLVYYEPFVCCLAASRGSLTSGTYGILKKMITMHNDLKIVFFFWLPRICWAISKFFFVIAQNVRISLFTI